MSKSNKKKSHFVQFAQKIAYLSGSATIFVCALSIVLLWVISGPIFDYSDTWQLVINTGTTIITFLMVFLIQNTQNRESIAVQLKLDELIRATKGAHTVLLDIEEMTDEQLEQFHKKYEDIATEARKRLKKGKSDADVPKVILEQ